MIVAAPIPAAVPKPAPTAAPTVPAATPSADVPSATPKVDDAPTVLAGQAADGAKQQAPAPGGGAAPVDAAAARQSIIEKLQATSAADAIAQVDGHLEKLSALSVGGGTPEALQTTKVASALLTDSSMLLQHAHVKAMEQLRDMATELQMRVMSSVSGLAYLGGQVAIAGQSKTPVKLADIAAGPITETKATMGDVISAITPKDVPKADTPAPDAKTVPVPSAPNGNTGVAGAVPSMSPNPA